MPSEHRKQELLWLLGNCGITFAFATDESILEQARVAAEQHIRELNQDYPDWQRELEK